MLDFKIGKGRHIIKSIYLDITLNPGHKAKYTTLLLQRNVALAHWVCGLSLESSSYIQWLQVLLLLVLGYGLITRNLQ